jgi:hypothetical protein
VSLTVRAISVFVAISWFTVPGNLHAAPGLFVSTSGDCPSKSDIEAAIVARGLELRASNYVVVAQSEPGAVVMRLFENQGQQLLERRFESQDCRALSDAVAVVVEAYFIELKGPRGKEGATPRQANVNVGSTTSNDANATPHLESPPSSAAPIPVGAGLPHAAQSMNVPRTAPSLPEAAVSQYGQGMHTESVSQTPMRAGGFMALGPALALPQGNVTSQIELGGGMDFPTVPMSTELAFATTWPTTSGVDPRRVKRWSSQGLVRIGMPYSNRLRYRPWAGLGLTFAQLRALDVAAAPTRTTRAAIIGAGLELAWPIGRGWWGRLDVGCLVLLPRDVYRVEPDGEIGHGPRVVCSSMIGIGLGGTPVNREKRVHARNE